MTYLAYQDAVGQLQAIPYRTSVLPLYAVCATLVLALLYIGIPEYTLPLIATAGIVHICRIILWRSTLHKLYKLNIHPVAEVKAKSLRDAIEEYRNGTHSCHEHLGGKDNGQCR